MMIRFIYGHAHQYFEIFIAFAISRDDKFKFAFAEPLHFATMRASLLAPDGTLIWFPRLPADARRRQHWLPASRRGVKCTESAVSFNTPHVAEGEFRSI